MTDEQFTAWLREHASGYNTPPAVPAELVWSRIADEVWGSAAMPGARAVPVALHVLPRRHRRWHSPAVTAGALFTAAVVVGIVIGRLGPELRSGATVLPPVAVGGAPAPAILPSPSPSLPQIVAGPPAGGPVDRGALRREPAAARGAARRSSGHQHHVVAQLPQLPRPGVPSVAPDVARDPGNVYAMTRDLHLAESEALLSAFRTDVKARRVDPAIARMARDLLTRTRVLYDAPATNDPQVKALLSDLELILIQLSTYRPDRTSDLKMAAQAIDESGLLPRLREATSL